MAQSDFAPANIENTETNIAKSIQPTPLFADVMNAKDMKAVFGKSDGQNSSGDSSTDHLTFTDPYGNNDRHDERQQGQTEDLGKNSMHELCHKGGGSGSGSDSSSLIKLDKTLMADLQTLQKDLTTFDMELEQILSGSSINGGGATTGSDSGSGNSGTTTTGSDAGSGNSGTTTTGSDAGSGNSGTTTTGSDAGSGNSGTTTTGSDAGGGNSGTTTTGSDSGSGNNGTTTTGSDSGGGSTTNASGGIDIPGVTSANNAQLAKDNTSLVDGQGTGPDALHLASSNSGLSSVDPAGDGFSQKYGYFEATAKIESGGSGWPGTWLESLYHAENPNASPSAEIDFMEAQTGNSNGQGDNAYYATLHSSSTVDGTTPGTTDQTNANSLISGLPNLSAGYHTFGINDQPNDPDIEFYLDGKVVADVPKYSDTDGSPMLINLDNVTGGWNNAPADTTTGDLDVKSVRVFQDASLINSSNDPGGTIGTDLTNLSASEAPPDIPGVSWVNTFNSDFTNGGISGSGDGAKDNTLWTAATPEYPYEPWSMNGISSGSA